MLTTGADGVIRCTWGSSADDYAAYHDTEWGRRVTGETALYERLTLEAFQSGLSWLTILRKRDAFREAFQGFSAAAVADFGAPDVDRLMADARIVRNRRKVEATIVNARGVLALREEGGLEAFIQQFAPGAHRRPATPGDVVGFSTESTALAQALKGRGFAHVGPTTCYSLFQACGFVNDHAVGCEAGDDIEANGSAS